VYTFIGIQCDVSFERCPCTSEAQTLLQAGFFPASATKPRLAFALELLDLLEALLLECQVAVSDFVSALHYLHNLYADHTLVYIYIPYSGKVWQGKFDKSSLIHQTKTIQIST